jgi:beta-lactamase regulating signal transducer with metallopeptidase domain
MRIAVYLPLLCSVLVAVVLPRLATRHLPAAIGMWTVTLSAGLCAMASTWSLILLAGTLLDEVLPDITGRTFHDPVNDVVAIAAALALGAGAVRLARAVRVRSRLYRQLRGPCQHSRARVVVLADPVPRAFAVPGAGGHVVVSQGMLAALSADERRVLFAHEWAHLRAAHHWHTGLVSAAVALNPLLTPLRAASAYACERCADEVAAAEVGDRGLAASSLARAALAAAAAQPCAAPVMSYHHTGVGARVVALQRAPARGRLGLVAPLLALMGLAVTAEAEATRDFLLLVLGTVHR